MKMVNKTMITKKFSKSDKNSENLIMMKRLTMGIVLLITEL